MWSHNSSQVISFAVILSILLSSFCNADIITVDSNHIEYSIRDAVHNRFLDKLNLDIQVNLINGRLPTEKEVAVLSNKVLQGQPKAKMTWVFYHLPEMPSGHGAFATDHRAPEPEGVKILPYMLYNTPYQKFWNDAP